MPQHTLARHLSRTVAGYDILTSYDLDGLSFEGRYLHGAWFYEDERRRATHRSYRLPTLLPRYQFRGSDWANVGSVLVV